MFMSFNGRVLVSVQIICPIYYMILELLLSLKKNWLCLNFAFLTFPFLKILLFPFFFSQKRGKIKMPIQFSVPKIWREFSGFCCFSSIVLGEVAKLSLAIPYTPESFVFFSILLNSL